MRQPYFNIFHINGYELSFLRNTREITKKAAFFSLAPPLTFLFTV